MGMMHDPAPGILKLLRPLLIHDEFDVAATEFLLEFARSVGFERASLGFFDGRTISIGAVSQHYDADGSLSLPEVAAAMEESIRQDVSIACPQQTTDFPHIVVAHADLIRRHGLSSALTIPFGHKGRLIGAITLEGRQQSPINAEMLVSIETLAQHAGPLLKLKWSREQPLSVRFRHAVQAMFAKDPQQGAWRGRVAVASGALLCAVALFLVPMPNRVAGQARLEASVQRVMSVPVDGYLKEVRVRPGDRVQAQQALAELNDDTLRAEHRKLEAETAQQENALAESMLKGDRTQVALRRAKLDELVAQKDLVSYHLARMTLIAPFDGVVIKGDLTQLLGSPLKRGDALLTLSQGTDYRVIVEVPEQDIADIHAGQTGTLVLSALPDQRFAIRVARITPIAGVSADGRNVFEIEAALDATPPKLVPGLKGVAKIVTGNQPLGWRWTAYAWHKLSFLVWSQLG